MATASVTLSLNNSAFLAGMARARSAVSGLGASAAGIAGAGIAAAGVAIAALGTATAVGIKKAFDFGGKLADLSAISGRSTREILLLRRALQDAGISMEKIDRYILTGQDRGQVIARALENMSSGDWADAAASVGKQADILEENAKTFDRVSDLLGRSGDKLRGFFVGAAGAIGKSLLPILERLDKMDLATQGQKFGEGLVAAAQTFVGFFKEPGLIFDAAVSYFSAGIRGVGNVLIAIFKAGANFFRDGMFTAIAAIGTALLSTMLEAIKKPLSYAKTGIALLTTGQYVEPSVNESSLSATAMGLAGKSGQLIDEAAKKALSSFQIKDVLGAAGALKVGNNILGLAGDVGRGALPTPQGATGFGQSAVERAAAGQAKLEESQRAAADIISKITTSGQSGLSSFGGQQIESEFATRWGMPKPSDSQGGKDQSAKEQLKEQQTTNEILRNGLLTDQQ